MKARPWYVGSILVALVALVAANFYYGLASEFGKEDATRSVPIVTAPSPAAESAWNAYVDRRLAVTVRRNATDVTVRADLDGFIGNMTSFPFGTPFDVACTRTFGGVVHFGSGGDAVIASIFGPTVVEPPAERPPPLNFDPQGPAAMNFQKVLCARITTVVRTALAQ